VAHLVVQCLKFVSGIPLDDLDLIPITGKRFLFIDCGKEGRGLLGMIYRVILQ
jgi:hypothetical protein